MNSRLRQSGETSVIPNNLSLQMSGMSASSRINTQGYVRQHSEEDRNVGAVTEENNDNQGGNVVLNFESNAHAGGIHRDQGPPVQADANHQPRAAPNNSYLLGGRNNNPDESIASNVNDNTTQNAQIENEVIQQILKDFLVGSLKLNIVSCFFLGLVILCIKIDLPTFYPVCFLWVYDLYCIFSIIRAPAVQSSSVERRKKCLGILNNVVQILFKVFVAMWMAQDEKFKIVLPMIPLLFTELIQSINTFYTNKKHFSKFFYILGLGFKIFLVAQIFNIGLKIDGFIDWRWREVFWVYWVVFSILIGFTFASILMFLNKCCAMFFGEVERHEMRGVSWLFLHITGQTGLSCLLIIKLLAVLDEGEDLESLFLVLVGVMGYNFIFSAFTIISFKSIEKFLKRIASVEEASTANDEENIPSGNEEANKKDKNKSKEPENLEIPKFLTKFSSTYFRRATEKEVDDVKKKKKDKEKEKDKETTEGKKKIQVSHKRNPLRHLRNSSFDYSRLTRNTNSTTETQMNLLTVQETDRESQQQNVSTFDFGLATTGRRDYSSNTLSSNRYNKDQSILHLNLPREIQQILKEEADEEDRKDEDSYDGTKGRDDTIRDDELPSSNINALHHRFSDAPFVTDLESHDEYIPEPTGEGLLREERSNRKSDVLGIGVGEDKIETLADILKNSNINSNHNTPVTRHRRIQSLKVIPKPMYVTVGNPVGVFGDNEVSVNGSRVDVGDVNEVSQSQDQIDPKVKALSVSQSMEQKCLVCFDKDPDAVFMECGHGGVCYDCSLEVWKTTGECYLCRDKITQVLQVDLASKLAGNVMKVISATQMVVYEGDEEEPNLPNQESRPLNMMSE